jgi:hypothetical protein
MPAHDDTITLAPTALHGDGHLGDLVPDFVHRFLRL